MQYDVKHKINENCKIKPRITNERNISIVKPEKIS